MTATVAVQHRLRPTRADWPLWGRWVLATAAGELLGLGTTALLGAGLVLTLGLGEGLGPTLTVAAAMILGGMAVEGATVGVAQWLVLRGPLPRLGWRPWVLATAIGAGAAWALGMIPSTAMSLLADGAAGTGGASGPAAEPSGLLFYGLVALMGLVLGPVLGLPQWLVLRRYVALAGWWMPAQSAARALGMIVIFLGTNAIGPEGLTLGVVALLLAALAVAGAVVGAVHGLALLWLLHQPRPVEGPGREKGSTASRRQAA
jgi:hypothetical protein